MSNCVCISCKKEFPVEEKIRCPYCGYRIIAKKRSEFRKRVKAE